MPSPPFGIQKGDSKNEIKVGEEISRFLFAVTDIPKPHSDFPKVFAIITPLQGASRITALGRIIQTDKKGLSFIYLFNRLIEQLSNKYGKPLRKNDNWTKCLSSNTLPSNHMIDLSRLKLSADWVQVKRKKIKILLPNDLQSIQLSFCAENALQGSFILNYVYDNYELAIQEIKNADTDAL